MRRALTLASVVAAAFLGFGLNGYCAENGEFSDNEVVAEVAEVSEEVSVEEASDDNADADYICAEIDSTEEAPVVEIEATVEEVSSEDTDASVEEDEISADDESADVIDAIIDEEPVVEPVIDEEPVVAPVIDEEPVAAPAESVDSVEAPAMDNASEAETPAEDPNKDLAEVPAASTTTVVVVEGDKVNGTVEASDEDVFVPETPETPEEPEEPKTPDVPEVPETPEVPEQSEQPEQPAPTEEVHENPVVPETYEAPVEESVEVVPAVVTIDYADDNSYNIPEEDVVTAPAVTTVNNGRYVATGDESSSMDGIVALCSLILLCGYAVAKSTQKKARA